MRMRKQRLGTVVLLVFLIGLIASASVEGRILQQGIGYCNYNFSPVTLTYSWSGNYPGQGEVCLKPVTIVIPPGQCVHLNPPAGFNPTDFVILSAVLNGQDSGGGTIYDPPTETEVARIEVPCAAEGHKVWFFQYFGEKDFGPIFANSPMAMDGLDADGSPKVVAADRANGAPVLNTGAGHCYVATADPVFDVTTGAVRPEYAPRTQSRTCFGLIFGAPSNNTSAAR
jgi:hypothetical protein